MPDELSCTSWRVWEGDVGSLPDEARVSIFCQVSLSRGTKTTDRRAFVKGPDSLVRP